MKINIAVNHIGYLCNASKKVIIESDTNLTVFTVQDMSLVAAESFDKDENWKTVYTGNLAHAHGETSKIFFGDFSTLIKPGIYSIVLPEVNKRSFQFIVSDGIWHQLPWIFVDFLNLWKGTSETPFKIKSTTDDGIRSDNKEYHPVKSGWYDAGDLRKWMTHTNLPAIGFFDLAEKLHFRRNYFHQQNLFDNDLITVSDEAVNLILEMQDPKSGRIFECLGSGGFGRADENMSWWYENHSGCLADNSDNRFTDNKVKSGDERMIRTDYNALIQYTCIYILLRAVKFYNQSYPEKASGIIDSVKRIIQNVNVKSADDLLEKNTAVKSWKLMAYIEMHKAGLTEESTLEYVVRSLLTNYNGDIHFWCQNEELNDPYRGILHSAQPLIALVSFLQTIPSADRKKEIENLLHKTWKEYIFPLCNETTYGFMPYGTWFEPPTDHDKYTTWKNSMVYRKYMPAHSKQKINHGLNGHYMSWAHALAMMGEYFNDPQMTDASWNQIYHVLGYNHFNVSFITGVGYKNPMPHSRFLGTAIGGFMAGFIGNPDDSPHVDLEARAQWNSTEYWNTPIANLCMALAVLLPEKPDDEKKLGQS